MDDLKQRTEAEIKRNKTLTSFEVLEGDDILGSVDKLRAVAVVTPEWKLNSQVFVAELSADERDQLETEWVEYKQSLEDESNVGFRAFCVAFCICSEARVRLFSQRVDEAAEKIGARNGKATSRIFNVISQINGLTKADIDTLEGN